MPVTVVIRQTIHQETVLQLNYLSMRDSIDEHVEAWSRQLPGLDPVEEQIVARRAKVMQHLKGSRSDALDTGGLAMWQFKTLLMLRREGEPYELSPSRLAEILGLTRGALSARLANLEDLGLVARSHDHADRRRVTVRLTTAGREAVESLLDKEERDEGALLSVLTDREKDTLAKLLRKLVLAIES